ncbi:MAG: trypsin-like peptidase domain-containing protein [Thermoflexales bacterium]|nr:trypsin-like peptidase domain-containing protein [Thermoflexales bacterium]
MKRIGLLVVICAMASLACSMGRSVTPAKQATSTPAPVVPKTATAVPLAGADEEESLLVALYERANPAVVNIDVADATQTGLTDLGSGSGFVLDTQGHIVTNNHVVADADDIRVTFWDGRVAKASLVGSDPYSDLAVIKVDAPAGWLSPLALGDSSALRVGQRVVAIGNPFGLKGSMTVGIVSALGRSLPATSTSEAGRFQNPDIIQTDAAINPGNSGGPLLNMQGEVVGINSAIRTEGLMASNSGVGFAVSSNTVKRVAPQLIQKGTASYPYMGISVDRNFSLAELAAEVDMPVELGVLVDSVLPGEAADRAGLRGSTREVTVRGVPVRIGGDIIIAIDDVPLRDFDEMIIYLTSKTEVGQKVTLTVMRGNTETKITLELGARPQ